VEAVGVHVVRESAGAADARDEHHLLPRGAERSDGLLHLSQDGVIAATRTPADFLIAGQFFRGQNRQPARKCGGKSGHKRSPMSLRTRSISPSFPRSRSRSRSRSRLVVGNGNGNGNGNGRTRTIPAAGAEALAVMIVTTSPVPRFCSPAR